MHWISSDEVGNNNGWGNGESQYYTSRLDNLIVESGALKITAIKEEFNGYSYTSTRITTQTKFNFKYGKIDVRAKLPTGAGTWPAIWMLGKNINDVSWPYCGEIDIMEQKGWEKGKISSVLYITAQVMAIQYIQKKLPSRTLTVNFIIIPLCGAMKKSNFRLMVHCFTPINPKLKILLVGPMTKTSS